MKKVGLMSIITFFFISMAAFSYAEVPKLLNYQGYLTDTGGNPLTGTYDITIVIYDAATNGTELWSEQQNDVLVSNGLFGVLLGSATVGGIPSTVFTGANRWLGIT